MDSNADIKEKANHLKDLENGIFNSIRKKFFEFIFYDTSILFKILYHKYFLTEVFNEIDSTNCRKLASDMNLQNELRIKMKNNLKFPSKALMDKILEVPNIDNCEDFDENNQLENFEVENKSKEYLKEYIKICKFNWLNNFTTFTFLSLLGISCVIFKYHKKHKNLSNRMFMIILVQILMNGTCIYLSLRTHPDEMFLQKTYAKQLEKYKIILKE